MTVTEYFKTRKEAIQAAQAAERMPGLIRAVVRPEGRCWALECIYGKGVLPCCNK